MNLSGFYLVLSGHMMLSGFPSSVCWVVCWLTFLNGGLSIWVCGLCGLLVSLGLARVRNAFAEVSRLKASELRVASCQHRNVIMAPFRLRGLVVLVAIFLGTQCFGKGQQAKIAFAGGFPATLRHYRFRCGSPVGRNMFWDGWEKGIGQDSAKELAKEGAQELRHALREAAQQLGLPFAIPSAAAHLKLPFVSLVIAFAWVFGCLFSACAEVARAIIQSFCVICVCGIFAYIRCGYSDRRKLMNSAPVIVQEFKELSSNLCGQTQELFTQLSITAVTAVKSLPETPPPLPPPPPPPPALNEWSQGPVQRVACSPEDDKNQKHPRMHWGITNWPNSGGYHWHSHNYVKVLYVKSGQLRLEIERQGVWDASPGEKIVVPARTKHRIPPGSPYCRLDIAHDWANPSTTVPRACKGAGSILQPFSITHSVRNAVNAWVVSWPTPLRFCVDHKLNAVGFWNLQRFPVS